MGWARLVLAATISIAVLATSAEGADQRSASAAAGGRVCQGHLVLAADAQNLTLASASHWDTDSWTHAPPHAIYNGGGPASYGSWESEGGSHRGCGNTVRYHAGHMTLEFSLTKHWNGTRSYHCANLTPPHHSHCLASVLFDTGHQLSIVWVVRLE